MHHGASTAPCCCQFWWWWSWLWLWLCWCWCCCCCCCCCCCWCWCCCCCCCWCCCCWSCRPCFAVLVSLSLSVKKHGRPTTLGCFLYWPFRKWGPSPNLLEGAVTLEPSQDWLPTWSWCCVCAAQSPAKMLQFLAAFRRLSIYTNAHTHMLAWWLELSQTLTDDDDDRDLSMNRSLAWHLLLLPRPLVPYTKSFLPLQGVYLGLALSKMQEILRIIHCRVCLIFFWYS